jgi:ABC-type multidrug transport system ATPase subunit
VSFGVSQGECFALLGLSGAGKTSTLNMIMGLESIQGGKCTIQNSDLKKIYKQPEKLQGLVGYCP